MKGRERERERECEEDNFLLEIGSGGSWGIGITSPTGLDIYARKGCGRSCWGLRSNSASGNEGDKRWASLEHAQILGIFCAKHRFWVVPDINRVGSLRIYDLRRRCMKVVNKTTLTDGAQPSDSWVKRSLASKTITPNQHFFCPVSFVTNSYIMLHLFSRSNIHDFHPISPLSPFFLSSPTSKTPELASPLGQQQVHGSSQVGGQRGSDAAVCAQQRQRDRRPTRVMSSEMVPACRSCAMEVPGLPIFGILDVQNS